MTIATIAEALSLEVLCSERNLGCEIDGGYASDMLSCVMAGAQKDNIWVTLLTHLNVIAVAVLLEIPAVVITENSPVEETVLKKAEDEGVVLLHTAEDNYAVVGKLYELGVK
jgi:serine kinase of HPr protein (carbohydrate metabolism regulator)